jgi:hypothetical protein
MVRPILGTFVILTVAGLVYSIRNIRGTHRKPSGTLALKPRYAD